MRCFVAVAIPDAIREALRDAQGSLRSIIGEARWVRPEGIHLTLRFLGEIDETMTEAVGRGLSETVRRCGPPFSLAVGGIGYFPPRGRPRVIWVGLSNPVDDPTALSRLSGLQSAVEQAVRDAGMDPETRHFSPHLTLARLDERGPRKPPAVPADAGRGRGLLPVDALRLYRSTLSRSGASYDVLREYTL